MYGIVEIKGHQYMVKPGDIIDVEKVQGDVGTDVNFGEVLFIGGDKPSIGSPLVEKANIKARIIKQDRGEKILIAKRRPRGWMKKKGHRQNYTGLLITEVNGPGVKLAIDKKSKNAEKYLK